MSTVYFASDLHHGHKNICNFRHQFSTVEEHDEYISDRILSTCDKRDTLWLLGDLFFASESIKYFVNYHKYIGNINIVLGNHCTDNSVRLQNTKYIAQYCNKIGSLFSYNGFWLSHAPIHPMELRGKRNIHGHMHNETVDDDRYFSVCLEQIDYKPITFSEIKDRMSS